MENSTFKTQQSHNNVGIRGRNVLHAGAGDRNAEIVDISGGRDRRMARGEVAATDRGNIGQVAERRSKTRQLKRGIQLADVALLGFCVVFAIYLGAGWVVRHV